jgi:hypothetical protein
MLNTRIPTNHIFENNDTIFVYDVVKIDKNIYKVECDKKFHCVSNKNETIWSTNKKVKKMGTIAEYPEYFI